MRKPVLGIVNRFPASGVYKLGEHFERNGILVYRLDLSLFSFTQKENGSLQVLYDNNDVEPNIILWRLSENLYPATKLLAETLESQGKTLINSAHTLTLCGDKFSTHQALAVNSIPTVDSLPGVPGQKVEEGMIAKPAQGAGGRSVIFGSNKAVIPLDTIEPWIVQPFVGSGDSFIRVLVVNGEALSAYRRIPSEGTQVNNVEAGGTRLFIPLTEELVSLSVRAAATCGAVVAGVDLTGEPYRVLEVNSNPGLPPELVSVTADALTRYLLQT